jgi:hypothetical protein
MTKKEILKKCDLYIELFNDLKNEERNNILEFMDFAYLHLPENSNLAFEINQLGTGKFSEHAERIKDFIKVNGSKTMKNNNFISDKNNFELISILFAFCLFGFGIGYWAKTFEIFSVIEKTKKSSSFVPVNTTKNVTNNKSEITGRNDSKNE